MNWNENVQGRHWPSPLLVMVEKGLEKVLVMVLVMVLEKVVVVVEMLPW